MVYGGVGFGIWEIVRSRLLRFTKGADWGADLDEVKYLVIYMSVCILYLDIMSE